VGESGENQSEIAFLFIQHVVSSAAAYQNRTMDSINMTELVYRGSTY